MNAFGHFRWHCGLAGNAGDEFAGFGINISTRRAGLQYGYVQAVLSCRIVHVRDFYLDSHWAGAAKPCVAALPLLCAGFDIDTENPINLVVRSVIFLLLIWYCDDIVNLALQIGGTPYTWILDSSLPGVQFGDFNSVLLIIIGVIANGSVALIALILVVILAWNYLKLLLEAAERYVVLGILVFTAPLAFAMGAARGTNNIFKSWCRMFSGQLLLLIMNAWCLKLFVNMVGEFLANPLSL